MTGVIRLKLIFFSFGDVQVTCTGEFQERVTASRSIMAPWSGCVTHRDITLKTEGKYQSICFCFFFCLNVSTCHQNTQTVELKANFSTTLMCSLVTAAGLCHLSVLYNDIDDYRGGWARGRGKGGVDDDVKWMRFQSCQLSEMASLIHQFPLLPKSHVQRTRDKQHVWF